MTHEELDQLGPELEKKCNDEIAKRQPRWSRYAGDQMLDATMNELAPDWSWVKRTIINGVPQIRLLQYHGEIE